LALYLVDELVVVQGTVIWSVLMETPV
jgi:hypothetical protein